MIPMTVGVNGRSEMRKKVNDTKVADGGDQRSDTEKIKRQMHDNKNLTEAQAEKQVLDLYGISLQEGFELLQDKRADLKKGGCL